MDPAEEKSMTLEEREDWLRERGVTIEHPNQGSANETANGVTSVIEQISGVKISEDTIPFVCIPQDESKQIFELQLPISLTKAKAGDCLPDYVKPYFAADHKTIDATLLKEQAKKQFAGGDLSGLADTNISTAAMNAAAAKGSVETFPLVHPADTNGFEGVYMYLDEVGLLKKLPNNNRATAIAATCGFHPPPNFYGDIFVGRVKSKPVIQNIGFEAKDTDRGAEWMQRATAENLAWQQEVNKVTNRKETQPAAIGTEGNAAVEVNFSWTQDEEEIEITVPLSDIDKSMVQVSFLSRKVVVEYNKQELVSIDLYSGVDVDGCTWTIDGSNIVITCEKAGGGSMWPRIQLVATHRLIGYGSQADHDIGSNPFLHFNSPLTFTNVVVLEELADASIVLL
eukprot:scaffold22677_cov139-Cylindrotheca_fusiformis.AAC.3